MRDGINRLLTPILIKDRVDMEWPENARAFYILSRTGLFLCRQEDLFRSCVPVDRWPSELADQESFLEHSYPKVPEQTFAQLVGFFSLLAETKGCEAGAYLVYDRGDKTVTALVPKQRATMRQGWSQGAYPVGLEYDNPTGLGPEQMILGTVHSHVYGAAYSSGIDVHDETEKPGVHIVVGRLDRDPPDLHAEAVVDGKRFHLEPAEVIEGSAGRDPDFPSEWLAHIEVVMLPRWSDRGSWYGYGGYGEYGSTGGSYGGYRR